ncbi:toxin-antitoxin system HicB family antitoxin [Streptomyces sp. NPDC006290]|uniref:toxin-antitoxin system HicB family antitoxin n=1 Tax=Streptomyces sp. NPDC006290 TaxID=3156745 RepID=UPI0033A07912
MFKFMLRIPKELHARLTARAAADRQPSTPRSCTCPRSPSTPSGRRRPDGDSPAPALLRRGSHSPPA